MTEGIQDRRAVIAAINKDLNEASRRGLKKEITRVLDAGTPERELLIMAAREFPLPPGEIVAALQEVMAKAERKASARKVVDG
jgi:hypothetical protein